MKNSFLSDVVSVFNSRVVVILSGLFTTIITARYLGPEANGVIAALMVYPTLFLAVGSLGVRQSTTYFVGQNKYSLEEIYSSALSIWIFTSIFCWVTSYLLITFFTKGTYSTTLVLLALIPIPFSLYSTYSSGIFLGKQNIKEFNQVNWVPAVVTLISTFLLVVVFPYGIAGSLASVFLGAFFLFFIVFNKLRKTIPLRIKFNWVIIKNMLGLGTTYAVSLLIIHLNYRADIIILERLSNAYELGIYSKGVGIVNYLWEIPTLLSTIVFSRSVASKNPKEFSEKVCRLLRFAGITILGASVILYFTSDFIIQLLYGTKFAESAVVLKILMPGVFLLTIFKVLNMDIAGKGKPWLAVKAMAPAVILNIILNYLWIPGYGANGSAMASTVSYTLAAITFLYIYSSEVGIPVSRILKITNEDMNFAFASYKNIKNKLFIKNG